MKLEKLAEKEITIRSLGVLSFSKRKKDTLSFFLLKGTVPENIFEESFLKDKDNYLSMKRPETAKLFSSRFVRDKEKNGVYLYSLDNQLVFAPRDTRTGETSAFVKDLSMLLGIGMPDTSFGNLARDLYLAEKLNDTGKEIAVCYCTQETVGNVVRPIGAVEVPREPVWDRHRRYATEAAEKKAKERYSAAKEKYDTEMDRIRKEEIKSRLISEYGLEAAESLISDNKIIIKRCRPSELVVMSWRKKERNFLLLDPRNAGEYILREDSVQARTVRKVNISTEAAKKYGINVPLLEAEGFLLYFETDNGEKGIIIPGQAGFTNDFCRKIGIATVCGGLCPARDIYLADSLKKDGKLKFMMREKGGNGVTFYEGVKIYSPVDEKAAVESIEVIANIKEQIEGMGFRQRSVRKDGFMITVDFEMMDGRKPIVVKAGKYEITPGLEFSMSEGTQLAYRLAGVFFYKDAVFYCGSYKPKTEGSCRNGAGSVYSKKKKYGEDISQRLINGFFLGDESAADTERSVYSYMLEQAGLFEQYCTGEASHIRSTVFMNRKRGEKDTSVFEALAEENPVPIKKTMEQLLNRELFSNLQIPKKMGKKKIQTLIDQIDKNEYGSKLDVLMLLASLSKHEAPINYRSLAMQVPGDILGYYGYK